MTFVYKFFPAMLLALSAVFHTTAQTINWEALNGPSGVFALESVASDADGRVFMYMNNKIYRSTDQGDSWSEAMTGLPQDLGSLLRFLRAPSGVFYVHFNSSLDSKLYRYLPASNSWSLVPLPFGPYDLDGLDFDKQGRLWASTDESYSILQYSTNGGQTFQKVTSSGQIQGWFDILATYNDAHNLIAVSYGANQKVYHFTITGTVTQVISGRPASYLGYNPNTGTAFYSDSDGSRRSTDGGLSWLPMTLQPGALRIYNMFFEPGGRIWAQTNLTMFYSDDDGSSWTQHATLSATPGTYYRMDNGDWYVTNSCKAPNFSRTADLGATWTDLSVQFRVPNVQAIRKDAAGNLYALACRKGAYEKSTDGGQSWTDLVVDDGGPVLLISLATRPDGLILAIGANHKLYRSFDNGINWSALQPPPVLPTLNDDQVFIDGNGSCYYVDYFGQFYRSGDSGSSWQQLNFSAFFYFSEPAFHPNGDIYVADLSVGYHYHADGDSTGYIQVPGAQLFDFYTFHCTSTGTVFFTGYEHIIGGGGNGLYRISNGNGTPELLPFAPPGHVWAITSDVEGRVYLFTENTVYRSADLGDTWTNIGDLPVSYPRYVLLSQDQYLYIGYSGAVIHRSAEPLSEANTITGRVWIDADGDCSFNTGEAAPPPVALTASGAGTYTAFSGYNGAYTLTAPSGNFALNVKPPNALFEPCFTDVPLSLDGPNDSAVVDMPLRAVAQCPYLGVNLSAPILRRCFDVTYTVFYKNEGTAPASDAYVEITLDSFFIFQNAGLPVAAQNGQAYTFNLGTLAPGQSGAFKLTVNISCDASLGQEHCIGAHIFPDELCLPALTPRFAYSECRMNIGAFDPNDKRAFVQGKEEPGYVLPDTEVEYFIRFQNTGTDTAFRVVVEDRLPGLLDLGSVTPVAASHPYTLELRDQRALRFVFDNILLPDSNINEAASHGYIKFRVAQQPNLPWGTVIRNEADIFFDFNAPVRTNASTLIVGAVHTHPEPGNPYRVAAWPNPFGDVVSLEISGPALPGPATLRLFDALGREVRREVFNGERFVLQRAGLPAGLYYFQLESVGLRVGAGRLLAR